jgi:hypothetical protein
MFGNFGDSGNPKGAVAQLGERLLCKQEVTGSIPVSSTSSAGRKNKKLPNAGRQPDTVIICITVTRNVVLAPIIGQVRRAARRSTPSYVERWFAR